MSQVEPELAPVPLRLERSAAPGRGWELLRLHVPQEPSTSSVLREKIPRGSIPACGSPQDRRPRGHHRQSGRPGTFTCPSGQTLFLVSACYTHIFSTQNAVFTSRDSTRRRTIPGSRQGAFRERDLGDPFGRGIWATQIRPSRQPCRLHFRGDSIRALGERTRKRRP
jgi:hypothetical protein